MKRIEFSILQYFPSFITGECINLGILIHCAEDNFIKFEHIKPVHYSRLKAFDDELDTEIVTLMLNMLSEDVEDCRASLISTNPFNMKEYIRDFANEFRFSVITSVDYESTEAAVDELKKVYLRLYYPKSERASKTVELNFVERIIKTSKYNYSKASKEKDDFGFNITYDFKINNEAGIKLFCITEKNINKIVNSLKTWIFNCEHSTLSKSIIVYSYESSCRQNPMLNNAIDLLKSKTEYAVNIDSLENVISALNLSK